MALQRGEDRALDEIMTRWQRPLFSFAWRYVHNTDDAHDLVAETFVRLHQQRLRLRADTRLGAWMFTTLANLCHNHNRWRRRHPTISLDSPEAPGQRAPSERLTSEERSPAFTLEQQEEERALRAAIDKLPHEQKTALLLHHFDQLPYQEIARITRCSERGVETRLYRARLRLRLELATFIHR